jgi:hypothetical protein
MPASVLVGSTLRACAHTQAQVCQIADQETGLAGWGERGRKALDQLEPGRLTLCP